jgi:hypothetical protein
MKPRFPSWDRKELNEFLNPLWRFLNSRVGKPWDKVYSEIRAQNSGRSAVGAHIYQHLFDFVVVNPLMVGKKPHHMEYWDGPRPLVHGTVGSWYAFWVDPHGILRRSPPEKKVVKKDDPRVRKVADGEFLLQREDGTWFCTRWEKPAYKYNAILGGNEMVNRGRPLLEGLPVPPCRPYTELQEVRTVSKKDKKKWGLKS